MTRTFVAIVGAAAIAFATTSAFAQNPSGTQAAQTAQTAQTAQGAKGAKGSRATSAGAAAKKKLSTQQQIESSVESGTVPAEYRSSIPKQFHQYIPFGQ